jgi:hypothetical protein
MVCREAQSAILYSHIEVFQDREEKGHEGRFSIIDIARREAPAALEGDDFLSTSGGFVGEHVCVNQKEGSMGWDLSHCSLQANTRF